MTAGGICPAIVGTLYADALARRCSRCRSASWPASTWPSTRREPVTTRAIRLSIANMAGVPSIVYGLFGARAVRASR